MNPLFEVKKKKNATTFFVNENMREKKLSKICFDHAGAYMSSLLLTLAHLHVYMLFSFTHERHNGCGKSLETIWVAQIIKK